MDLKCLRNENNRYNNKYVSYNILNENDFKATLRMFFDEESKDYKDVELLFKNNPIFKEFFERTRDIIKPVVETNCNSINCTEFVNTVKSAKQNFEQLKQHVKDKQRFYTLLNGAFLGEQSKILEIVRRIEKLLKIYSRDIYETREDCMKNGICPSDKDKYINKNFDTYVKNGRPHFNMFSYQITRTPSKFRPKDKKRINDTTTNLENILKELNAIKNIRVENERVIPKNYEEYANKCGEEKVKKLRTLYQQLKENNDNPDDSLYNEISKSYMSIFKDCSLNLDASLSRCHTKETDDYLRNEEIFNNKKYMKNGAYNYFDPFGDMW
jgi:hypothetical protein